MKKKQKNEPAEVTEGETEQKEKAVQVGRKLLETVKKG
jgi:hypothetical protein